ncbi:uncharacterized protein C8Q71DRAFT_330655 [Rhodofomes roseus]|uniref:Uncharacterized protein n=1 Tax=Rhodofomes roseus TaxID=34475 RepID=A0ABQ8KRN4_9APHY|nr:uncharacterized protein C8Q71DRAFT_330655 [Rhodofomes roseus]KAH9841461.1 hypothetical protein C8Q71DRAFT_330655 [Rhodofomes roseus]
MPCGPAMVWTTATPRTRGSASRYCCRVSGWRLARARRGRAGYRHHCPHLRGSLCSQRKGHLREGWNIEIDGCGYVRAGARSVRIDLAMGGRSAGAHAINFYRPARAFGGAGLDPDLVARLLAIELPARAGRSLRRCKLRYVTRNNRGKCQCTFMFVVLSLQAPECASSCVLSVRTVLCDLLIAGLIAAMPPDSRRSVCSQTRLYVYSIPKTVRGQ